MRVRCEILPGTIFAPSTVTTNGFTVGKEYETVRQEGNGYIVINDKGHERFVLPDGSPCAHIVARTSRRSGNWDYEFQQSIGCFVTVPDNERTILGGYVAPKIRDYVTERSA